MNIAGYSIERTLGKGGMATVYLARQAQGNRLVALKTLHGVVESGADPARTLGDGEDERAARLVAEGRIVAGLRHPHIIEIYDVGSSAGAVYMVMEYVPGGDLQGRLGAPLPLEDALSVLVRIGAALGAAHSAGIVHRDVKPPNILFRADGTPLLSDFGIAKEMQSDAGMTQTGIVMGSPFYISPEQAEAASLDGRSDLYSLGVVLYEMLTGGRPYEGTSAMRILMQHLQSPVPRLPPDVAVAQPLLERMMAKNPDDRFADAGTLVDEASALIADVRSGATARLVSLGAMSPLPYASAHLLDEVVESFRRGILEDVAHDRLVLPTLPDVALRVRQELEDPGSSSDSIARVLVLDPALSAQVLRVANSAFYFGQSPVSDLRRAVVRLGSSVVQQIVMMLIVSQLYDTDSRPGLRRHLEALWRHSLFVAGMSRALAERVRGLSRDTALLAGLIHDIGALPVLTWAEPIPSVMGDERTLADIRAALHGELGREILERWHYPPELTAVADGHECIDRQGGPRPDYVDIVQVANFLAHVDAGAPLPGPAWHQLAAAGRLDVGEEDEAELLEEGRLARDELAAALGRG